MKVLHLLDQTNRGGAESLTLDISKNANQNGLDLVVVSLGSGDLESEFENSGITYFKLNRKYSLDFRILFELRRIIKKNNIEIIHSHTVVSAVYAYLATIGLKVKNLLTQHGFSSNRKKIDEIWKEFLIPRMDMNIAVSSSFLDRLLKEKGVKRNSKFTVIYNGVDIKKFDIKYASRKASNKTITLGMVGNFINNKNQITICKALVEVKKTYPFFKFMFVGRRDERFPKEYDTCYNFCKDNNLFENVEFLGKRDDIPEILNSLDIFVFSSLNESFGIAPVEAMIFGLPVILSDIDVMKEISLNGKYAVLYKAQNEENLARKIIELIENPKTRLELSENGRKWAMSQFNIEKHISNLNTLYKSIL